MTTRHERPTRRSSPATQAAPTPEPGWVRLLGPWRRPTPRFVHLWSVGLLVANIGIVVTGGAVRVTDSGLGCPTWPRCTGTSFVPHGALGIHGAIEFGNRMLTWVLVAVAVATWLAVWRAAASTRRDRQLATLLALGIPFQGVIGGLTVLTKLNPWVVAFHFLLSMVLVSGATVLVMRTRPRRFAVPVGAAQRRLGLTLTGMLYAVTWVTIYLGTVVTGSGPHAGDIAAPRNGLDPRTVTQLHADAVFVLVGLTLAVVVACHVLALPQRRAALILAGIVAAQGVIGGVQYATGLPVLAVILHMFGSAVLLACATWLVAAFGRRAADAAPATPDR